MEGMQYDMLRINLHILNKAIRLNLIVTIFSFFSLITFIIFIQLHPKSVLYYLGAGFFLSEMLNLITEKTHIKRALKDTLSRLKTVNKPFDH